MRTRALVAVAAAALLSLTACGGTTPTASSTTAASLTIGIFVDDAFGDGDFFDQAAAAKEPLETKYGAKVTTYEGRLEAQNFEPLLQDAANANKLVFVLGFEAIDALKKVTKDNPDTTFVFVDGVVDGGDVVSAQFRTAEGCFMAGALAAVVKKDAGAAGFIGGVDAPVVARCRSGFEQGVAKVAPAMRVDAQFVGSFTDPGRGKEIAVALAGLGDYAVFSYAGLSGAGGFDAAKSGTPIAPIGVVADKSGLAPGKVPGSLTMGVDTVMLAMAKQYEAGDLKKGKAFDFGLDDGGWKMIYDDKLVGTPARTELNALQQQIEDGTLTVTDPGMP